MRAAVFKATAISLWRDRAAFALAFILPAAIFAIFSLVFSSAAGGDMKVRIALLAGADGVSQRLATDLARTKEIAEVIKADTPEAVGALVRSGRADVGYVLDFPRGAPGPVFTLYTDQTRGGAALVAESALARLAPRDASALKATSNRVVVNPVNAHAPMAAYFAAGVAMLFLFLSGFQSALTLLEERDAGVLERVAAGPAGLAAAIDGKFLFIVLQGLVQIGVILVAAAVLFRVDLSFAPGALLLASASGAVAAAGVTVAVTALCRSTRQAHAIGAVFSLVAAALGGSMAPRFLMPDAIQRLGSATPNALGIDAFGSALWTGGGLEAAAVPAGVLLLIGFAGLALAHIAARTTLRADA